jgi:hypothetical protein
MRGPQLRIRAPQDSDLTDYDRDHAVIYLRLLDAEEAGADWQEVAKVVLGVDPRGDFERAQVMHATHLARAKWMRDGGYKELLRKN